MASKQTEETHEKAHKEGSPQVHIQPSRPDLMASSGPGIVHTLTLTRQMQSGQLGADTTPLWLSVAACLAASLSLSSVQPATDNSRRAGQSPVGLGLR